MQVLRTLVTAHSRGGFVLQVGYFKATGRFFPVDRFLAADREHVQRAYALTGIDWARYDKMTSLNHRREILRQFGVAPFEEAQAEVLA